MSFRKVLVKGIGVLFLLLGLMNLIWVHPVPGILYWILASIYFDPLHDWMAQRIGKSRTFYANIIIGLLVLWGTLAVGDLAELAGL